MGLNLKPLYYLRFNRDKYCNSCHSNEGSDY